MLESIAVTGAAGESGFGLFLSDLDAPELLELTEKGWNVCKMNLLGHTDHSEFYTHWFGKIINQTMSSTRRWGGIASVQATGAGTKLRGGSQHWSSFYIFPTMAGQIRNEQRLNWQHHTPSTLPRFGIRHHSRNQVSSTCMCSPSPKIVSQAAAFRRYFSFSTPSILQGHHRQYEWDSSQSAVVILQNAVSKSNWRF